MNIIEKETIYTIPVMDALREDCECVFCAMHESLELNAINFLMGPSVAYMEDDVRMETNKKGFCGKHYRDLHKAQNRLGLVLMLHTHVKEQNQQMSRIIAEMGSRGKKGLFAKADKNALMEYVENLSGQCYVCEMTGKTFDRYLDTFFLLWKKEPEVRKLIKDGKGFCLPHFAMIADMAYQKLDKATYKEFCDIVGEVQQSNMKRIEDELEWFTKKFDYRFTNEPWGNSKDSAERAILKLTTEHIKSSEGSGDGK